MHHLKQFTVPLILLCAANAAFAKSPGKTQAETASATAQWDALKNFSSAVKVHITADHGASSHTCKIQKVDDEHLTCATGLGNMQRYTYDRLQIKRIKLVRRGRSAWTGASVGYAIGFAGIEIAGHTNGPTGGWNSVIDAAAVGAGLGISGVTAAVGALTDFARGPTIYQRR